VNGCMDSEGYMVSQTSDRLLKQLRSKQLHERAFFFKRLAIGAADAKFAAKLQGLVEEYESAAARITMEIEPERLRDHDAQGQGAPQCRLD